MWLIKVIIGVCVGKMNRFKQKVCVAFGQFWNLNWEVQQTKDLLTSTVRQMSWQM